MKKHLLLIIAFVICGVSFGQLSGTKNIPGDYPTLADAISSLNTLGVTAPGVTLNLLAGHPETAPQGGFTLTTLTSGESAPIVIQGNGNTISASTWHVLGSLSDAVFKIIGSDFVTITGFTIQENPLNTFMTLENNDMTEFGVALFYSSLTDGAKNITIANNTISLVRTYEKSIGIYSTVLRSATDPTYTYGGDITAASGANDNTHIYSNAISEVDQGIRIEGSITGTFMNTGTDIGGTSSSTGNTISGYGYKKAAGIHLQGCLSSNVSFNSISCPGLNIFGEVYGINNYLAGSSPSSGGPYNTVICTTNLHV